MKQKLRTHRPRTIGHASSIDGVTPAALTLLVAHVRRGKKNQRKLRESGQGTPISVTIKRAPWRSRLFHVKRKRGSIAS